MNKEKGGKKSFLRRKLSLEDTLSRLQGKKVGHLRMDSGFFSGSILDYLEQKHLHYITVCRFNNHIKCSLAHEKV